MTEQKMTTAQTSGNTKPEVCNKKRNFQLTLNNELFDENEEPMIIEAKEQLMTKYHLIMNYLTNLKYQYILSCIELNDAGFNHIHIFIQFNSPHKLSIKHLQGAHIEECRGSVNSNINYIKKDGDILDEYGTPKYITGNPSIKDISLSRFSDISENGEAKFYRVYKEIKKDFQPTFNTKKNVYYIHHLNNLTKIKNKNNFNNYKFFEVKEGKIKVWSNNLILQSKYINKNNIDQIFNPLNQPLNYKYYPADIENIIICFDDIEDPDILDDIDYHLIDYKGFIDNKNNLIKTIKDEDELDQGELDEYEI